MITRSRPTLFNFGLAIQYRFQSELHVLRPHEYLVLGQRHVLVKREPLTTYSGPYTHCQPPVEGRVFASDYFCTSSEAFRIESGE